MIPGDPSVVQRIVEAEEERYKEIVIKLNKELDNLQVCLVFDTKAQNMNLIVLHHNMIIQTFLNTFVSTTSLLFNSKLKASENCCFLYLIVRVFCRPPFIRL